MAGKARVHEIAKELGRTSREIMNELGRMGVAVKSPSSPIEAPIVRQLRDRFGSGGTPRPASRPQNQNYLLPPSRMDADEAARRVAAETFGVDPDSIRLRNETRGKQPRSRSANSSGAVGRRPGPLPRPTPNVHRSPSISPQATRTGEVQSTDVEWSRHLLDADDRRQWLAAGLRLTESNLAAQCIEYDITPDMLSLRLSGATLLERLRYGESIAHVLARAQEVIEAPTRPAGYRRGTG